MWFIDLLFDDYELQALIYESERFLVQYAHKYSILINTHKLASIRTHTNTYTLTITSACSRMYAHTNMCMYTYACVRVRAHTHTHTHTHTQSMLKETFITLIRLMVVSCIAKSLLHENEVNE